MAIAEEGLSNGHYQELDGFWEKIFFLLPLVDTEGPGHLERVHRAIAMIARLTADRSSTRDSAMHLPSRLFETKRETIALYGRYPERNVLLGRISTRDEAVFLARDRSL